MFKNVTTKVKLLILPTMFAVIVVLAGLIYNHFNHTLSIKDKNAKMTDIMVQKVLTGRISVYQFLRTPINQNVKRVDSDFKKLKLEIEKLLVSLDTKESEKIAKGLLVLTDEYLKYFNEFANLRIQEYSKGVKEESKELLKPIKKMVKIGEKLEKELNKINKIALLQKQEASDSLVTALIILAIVANIIFIFAALLLIRSILANLDDFKNGLISFFKYLNNEIKDVTLLKDDRNDEFGQMASLVNENINKTKLNIDQDRRLIDEAVKVLGEFEQGDFSLKINHTSSNETLNELTKVINHMSIKLENNINSILDVLGDYSNSNYTSTVSTKGIKADLEKLALGVNSLGVSISEFLKNSLQIGLNLDESSDRLIQNVQVLNDSANTAAASLEETAAALEEITSTIVNNGENITQMNRYTSILNSSAKQGQDLASKTTTAMDEINEQVRAINEAISVIDQIAFQTNILSLNAAVEAATAGEVGKGFAVVAAEVRNLASRSAEAAKEIKELVENATSKTAEGKSISAEMITGYNSLLENIASSTEKINEISNASKEQETGITQINDAINSLDKQTQENASIANRTNDIAIETDKVAKEIVEDAQSKEFLGKNEARIA